MQPVLNDKVTIINSTRSLISVAIGFTIVTLTLGLVGIFPWYPACYFALGSFITFLMCLIAPSSKLALCHMGLIAVLSPIWVLITDPCALPFAQMLSAVGMSSTFIEHRQKSTKMIYTSILVFSWCFVFAFKGILIQECQEIVSANLRNDVITIIVFALQIMLASSVQIDSLLKATKDALARIGELNSKNESLNTELKQLLEDKDNFILLFSHETRNPLNILLGNLTLLLDEIEDPRAKTRLNRCKFCADLLLQHLNNILDTGKLSSKGTLEVTPTSVRVCEYLQPISSFMEMLVKKKSSLKPELLIPQKLPTTLKFDTQRLTQVILNLLTNAVKFTDSGSISMIVRYLNKNRIEEEDYYPTTAFGYQLLNKPESQEHNETDLPSEFLENPIGSDVQINTHFRRELSTLDDKKKRPGRESAEEKGFLKIEVSDTGCGMKEEDLKKLFQKFSQTHTEGSHRQIGSGLGLWMTNR